MLHGGESGLFLALVLEALTKLINIVGAFNPGNVGTYEGGNMIIFRLLGISGAAGLTMALCRRARILFWAAIGALCLIVMSKATGRRELACSEARFGRMHLTCFYLKFPAIRSSSEAAMPRFGRLSTCGHPFPESLRLGGMLQVLNPLPTNPQAFHSI